MKVYPTYNQDSTTCMYCKQEVLPYEGYVIDTDVTGIIRHMICSHKAKELIIAEQEQAAKEVTTDQLASPTQALRTVILPHVDNNAQDLDSEIDEIKDELLWSVGGYTETEVKGIWASQSTGRVYRDVSVKIEVIVDSEQDSFIQTCLPRWATLLRQESLLTYVSRVEAQYVTSVNTYATVPLIAVAA